MNSRTLACLVTLTTTLGACSSVDQVPLVYISTAKVGLNVETGSPQTPGAKLMIGVDLTDAAYVPVAVARKCDVGQVKGMQDCIDKALELELVAGESNDATQHDREKIRSLAGQVRDLKGRLQKADIHHASALTAYETAARDSQAAIAVEARRVGLQGEKDAAVNAGVTFAKEDELNRAAAEATKRAGHKAALNSAEARVNSARQVIENERQELLELMAQFEGLVPKKNSASFAKKDALSVFGTFNGDINAEAKSGVEGRVALGKTFSTGVAAQHLAQSTGLATRMAARAACIRAVTAAYLKMAEAEQGTNPLSRLLESSDGETMSL